MSETADIVIVGAGIIGLSSAYQIARRSRARIVVLEKGQALGEGSTGASSAVCRAKYSRDETVRLARDGIAAYRNWGDFLGLRDPLAKYQEAGNLWIGSNDRGDGEAEVRRLRSLGVVADLLDDHSLSELCPAINPCPLAPDLIDGSPHNCVGGGAHLFERHSGFIDPMDALNDLLRAVRALDVDVRFSARVQSVSGASESSRTVETSAARISCGALVNAAGPWCTSLNAMVGLNSHWPLAATRIQIVHVERPSSVVGRIPVCADAAGGIYFRPQNRGEQIVVGSILEEDEREIVDPDAFDRTVDDAFAAAKLHALQHRLSGLSTMRGVRGYSGLYTMNLTDVHPVVGETPLPGYHVANGFSGHGFKLAPAIGALVAQAVCGIRLTDDTEIDPAFLAYARDPISIRSRSVLA